MEYKQTKYVIAIHPNGDKNAVENSIDEAKLYVQKFEKRKAVFVSRSVNTDLEKIVYNQIQSFRKGTIRQVDISPESNPVDLLEGVYFGLKHGMLIIHDLPVSDVFLNKLLNHVEKDMDAIIHRNQLMLMPSEINFIKNQLKKSTQAEKNGEKYIPDKRIIIRIHIDSGFKLDPEIMANYIIPFIKAFGEQFGQQLGYMLFFAQFVIQRMRIEYKNLCDIECRKNNEDPKYFLDPYHFSHDLATYCYIDILNLQLIDANPDPAFIENCQQMIQNHFEKLSQQMKQE